MHVWWGKGVNTDIIALQTTSNGSDDRTTCFKGVFDYLRHNTPQISLSKRLGLKGEAYFLWAHQEKST